MMSFEVYVGVLWCHVRTGLYIDYRVHAKFVFMQLIAICNVLMQYLLHKFILNPSAFLILMFGKITMYKIMTANKEVHNSVLVLRKHVIS